MLQPGQVCPYCRQRTPEPNWAISAPYTYDRTRWLLQRDAQEIPLTLREHALVRRLYDAQGGVVRWDTLVDGLWGETGDRNYVRTLLWAIRKKAPGLIVTVPWVGLRLA
jgi:DNA-binding winged helix-turn-helix (wHTH) protein